MINTFRLMRIFKVLLSLTFVTTLAAQVDRSCTGLMHQVVMQRMQQSASRLTTEQRNQLHATIQALDEQRQKIYQESAANDTLIVSLLQNAYSKVLRENPDLAKNALQATGATPEDLQQKYAEEVIKANPGLLTRARQGDTEALRKLNERINEGLGRGEQFSFDDWRLAGDPNIQAKVQHELVQTLGYEEAKLKELRDTVRLHGVEAEQTRVANSIPPPDYEARVQAAAAQVASENRLPKSLVSSPAMQQLLGTVALARSSSNDKDEQAASSVRAVMNRQFDSDALRVAAALQTTQSVAREASGQRREAELVLGHVAQAYPSAAARAQLMRSTDKELPSELASTVGYDLNSHLHESQVRQAYRNITIPAPRADAMPQQRTGATRETPSGESIDTLPSPPRTSQQQTSWEQQVASKVEEISQKAWTIILAK